MPEREGVGLTKEVLESVLGPTATADPHMAELTIRHLAAFETIAGLDFGAKKRRQALTAVAEQRDSIGELRSQGIGFDLGPAEVFDPRLPGVRFETEQRPKSYSYTRSKPPRLPGNDEDIAFAPLTALSSWVQAGMLTSERLTRIYLDRLKRYAPVLLCAPVILERQALAAARRADAELRAGKSRGPLHGIPWGAKDLLDTKGIATEWGAEPFLGRKPKTDAAVVRRLDEVGAILVAKLSLGALAMGDVWNAGMTRNPFDVEQGASGSSAGSASAVAAGLVGFAIGSETLGSIVSPSTRCGTAGLRPTFGRVPRGGAMPLCWSMDKLGPICREVEDTALVLEAITGYTVADQRLDPALLDAPPFNYNALSRIKGITDRLRHPGVPRQGPHPRAREHRVTSRGRVRTRTCEAATDSPAPAFPWPDGGGGGILRRVDAERRRRPSAAPVG